MKPSHETERLGDPVPVLVMAADGPVVVWHTPEEYAALWQGVDVEALGEDQRSVIPADTPGPATRRVSGESGPTAGPTGPRRASRRHGET